MDRKTATIVAALEYWREMLADREGEKMPLEAITATQRGRLEMLSADEVGELINDIREYSRIQ